MFLRILFCVYALTFFQNEYSQAQSVLSTEIHQKLMCITNGQVQPDSLNKLELASATTRGVVTTPTTQKAKIVFTYQAAIENSPDNLNDLRQIGIKLHAMNSCNVLYAMWPVAGGPVKVSLKRNDGMVYHEECKSVPKQGYTLLTPSSSVSVPPLVEGVQHTLQAEYDNTTVRVYADGRLVWIGNLSRNQIPFDGPVGFRSDGGIFKLRYFSTPETSLSSLYNLSTFSTYSCVPSQPSIRFSSSALILKKGAPIRTLTAESLAGFISNCSARPTLPSGLELNSTNCNITGTPTANQSSTHYTITASNSIGSFVTPLSIRVMTPPSIQFASSNLILKTGTAYSLTPSYSGNAVESCTVQPLLPNGLVLTNKCQIIGTASLLSALTQYKVTASNLVGSSSTLLNLEVKAPPVLRYSSSLFNFKLSERISLSLRSNDGTGSSPTSCVMNRPPPIGTTFNLTTCTISGYANAIQPQTTYTITGTNEAGSGSVQIAISITN